VPFINDHLAANVETNNRRNAATNVNRTSRFTFDPEAVIATLKNTIVGQDNVIAAMADLLYVLKADFGEPHRPLSVNLFLGPTGVGKTETVRVLAKALLGDENAICRIDMNTLTQEHYAAALTGAPPGYAGSKEGHTLFDVAAIEGSFSRPGIVLFDEIEKASQDVIRSLLNIFDSGILRLPGGTKSINFNNAIIFMTSNLGGKALIEYQQQVNVRGVNSLSQIVARLFSNFSKNNTSPPKNIVDKAIKKAFDPEFINRIERQLIFDALNSKHVARVVDMELSKINALLAKKNAHVTLDGAAKSRLVSSYDPEYGARNVAQTLRIQLTPVIAKAILLDNKKKCFEVTYQDKRFVAQ